LEHIANISVRSVDRYDRNTAIEGVLTLERIARDYWKSKGELQASWFEADPDFFLGFSSQALEEMTSLRSWTEMKLYYQFYEILRAASPRMPELTSTIAKSLRKLSLEPAALENPAVRDLAVEYFNTFIRLTLNRKDVRSLYIIFDQYRTFAECMADKFPEEVAQIAYYFTYYGQAARESGLPFVVETVAHDLATLVQKAWTAGCPGREGLLERLLQFDAAGEGAIPGVKKACALLAGHFLVCGEKKAAELIAESFRKLSPAQVARVRDELSQVTRQRYWEISERRMNMHFAPPQQQAKVREFFDALAAPQPEPAGPSRRESD
ncbi:MAG TPA: hypothetical protein VLS90_14040, partial [Thermodesulfobacteriota bacterium]|nr:hypothetical protein [Thermodesulfobacteriota bacterium]